VAAHKARRLELELELELEPGLEPGLEPRPGPGPTPRLRHGLGLTTPPDSWLDLDLSPSVLASPESATFPGGLSRSWPANFFFAPQDSQYSPTGQCSCLSPRGVCTGTVRFPQ
jgi:hypothetical protein